MPVHFRNYTAAIRRALGQGNNLGLTPHEVLIGSAAGGIGQVPALGAAGTVLTSNGAGADPSFQAASSGGPADKDVWLSGLSLPTGLGYTVLGETYPRLLATTNGTITSGTCRFQAIDLPAGLVLTRMTAIVANTAEAGGTDGWYAILDNTGKVQAVTADQTGATTWSPALTPVTISFTASYTTTYRGTYYCVICVSATTLPSFASANTSTMAGAVQAAPVLCGLGPLQSTPPALGATLALSAATNQIWSCVG